MVNIQMHTARLSQPMVERLIHRITSQWILGHRSRSPSSPRTRKQHPVHGLLLQEHSLCRPRVVDRLGSRPDPSLWLLYRRHMLQSTLSRRLQRLLVETNYKRRETTMYRPCRHQHHILTRWARQHHTNVTAHRRLHWSALERSTTRTTVQHMVHPTEHILAVLPFPQKSH